MFWFQVGLVQLGHGCPTCDVWNSGNFSSLRRSKASAAVALSGWYIKVLEEQMEEQMTCWLIHEDIYHNWSLNAQNLVSFWEPLWEDKTKIRAISTIMVRSSPAKRMSYNRTQEFNLLKNWRQMLNQNWNFSGHLFGDSIREPPQMPETCEFPPAKPLNFWVPNFKTSPYPRKQVWRCVKLRRWTQRDWQEWSYQNIPQTAH